MSAPQPTPAATRIECRCAIVDGRRVWQWFVKCGRKVLAGGMAATRRDAINDARILQGRAALNQ